MKHPRLITALCLALLAGAGGTCGATTVTVKLDDGAGVPVVDAIVILDPVGAASAPAAAGTTAIVDQVNRRFTPFITVVQTGTAIAFPNSDHIRHQVYSFSTAKTFTLKLYAGSPKMSVPFDKPGLVVLGCNIHDSMVGFIGVVDTAYFGKTPATGALSLDVPAGSYRLRIWHPSLASAIAPRTIKVAAGEQSISIQAPLDHGRAAPSPWPN